jgi:hypothetical protein
VTDLPTSCQGVDDRGLAGLAVGRPGAVGSGRVGGAVGAPALVAARGASVDASPVVGGLGRCVARAPQAPPKSRRVSEAAETSEGGGTIARGVRGGLIDHRNHECHIFSTRCESTSLVQQGAPLKLAVRP